MAEQRSPFDEREDQDQKVALPYRLGKPERKWSFIGLGIVLFVLVWVRELSQMSPSATFGTASVIIVGWLVVHIVCFTRLLRASNDNKPSRNPIFSGYALWLAVTAGTVIGVWLPFLFPLSATALSGLVVIAFVLMHLVGWLVSWIKGE